MPSSNRAAIAAAALSLFSNLAAAETVDCQHLRWRLVDDGTLAVYRGRVEPGTADIVHIEVISNSKGVIGQGMGFPNPAGNFEISVYGDYRIRKRHGTRFYCEKF